LWRTDYEQAEDVFFLTSSKLDGLISVPGEPQNVNARPINSSTIEVSWDPPVDKDKNGVIRGYQIHVQPKNMVSISCS
jgi:hypothetical protein